MNLIKTKFKGTYIINHKKNKDFRGYFMRGFCKNEFIKRKIKFDIKQTNFSFNKSRFTLRGFHYQVRPFSEDKIITCVKGEIFVVLININKKSKHYLKHLKIRLDEKLNKSLLISKNCAAAFLTLKKNTLVFYYMSNFYKKRKDLGIRYNDPKLKINWPYKPKVISNRDKNFKDLN